MLLEKYYCKSVSLLDHLYRAGFKFIDIEDNPNNNQKVWIYERTYELENVIKVYYSPDRKAERDKDYKDYPHTFRCYSLKLATYLCSNGILYLKEIANTVDADKFGWLYNKDADFYRVFNNYKGNNEE